MKQHKYCVIGGQYASYCYGCTPTILGAKRLAGQHDEHWDNWQGWHRPSIYRIEDTEIVNNFYGEQRAPKEYGVVPIAVYFNDKWHDSATITLD